MASDTQEGGPGERPRRVTVGSVLSLGGCVLLVFSMLDSMARVRSVESREGVQTFLGTPLGAATGLGVDQVMGLLRGAVFTTAGLAAAGAVLAGYALLRHRGARLGLSVTAVLLVLVGLATPSSALLPILVAVGATMLWGEESRDWFAGRPPRVRLVDAPSPPPIQPGPPSQGPPPQAPTPPPAASSGYAPAPANPWQAPQQAPQQGPPPAPWQTPYQPATGAQGYPASPPRSAGRPVSVSVAAWLTWVFCGLCTLSFLALALTLVGQRDQLVTELYRNQSVRDLGLSADEVVRALWVSVAVAVFWSLAAIALAVLTFRRVGVARVLLVVSAVLSGMAGVAAVPVGWPHALAAFVSAGLLVGGPANRWFRERR